MARSPVRGPGVQNIDVLPFVDVGSVRFEHLCRDIARETFGDIVDRTTLKRDRGQQQYGVDVECFDRNGDPAIVISAKCYASVNAWDFTAWIADFMRHLDGHWKGKGIRRFILAVTHETNDDGMNEAAKVAVADLRSHGIEFSLWNTVEMTRMMRDQAHLVEKYFHRHWVEALRARSRPVVASTQSASGRRRDSVDALATYRSLGILEDGFDAALAAELDAVSDAVRAGRPSRLRDWLERNRGNVDLWERMDVGARAGALRMMARLEIDADCPDRAGILLDEADDLSPPPDRSDRALLVYVEDGPDEALELLGGETVERERELRIGILIEAARLDEARSSLLALKGTDVSPEILRLRAILGLLDGRLDDALADAASAAERAPGNLRCLEILARVRFHRAIAVGFQPCLQRQPDALPAEMVRSGDRARDELSAAAEHFERAMAMVDDDRRQDLEIWLLGTLLLHPGRATDAMRLADEILSRPLPDATAVAWCLVHDRVGQPGRLRRTIGNAIREGRATPAHLVVFALLCSGNERRRRGASIIRRHAALFPEAVELFLDWRTQLGDPDAEGGSEFAAAIAAAREGGDLGPILDIATRFPDARTAFSVGELLASLEAWEALRGLRPVLSGTKTHRGIELIAIACLGVDDPIGCLEVLEEGGEALEDRRLPPSLVHLRIAANERLGRLQPALADLLSLRRDDDEGFLQARILDAYERLGDLENLGRETERALALGTMDVRRAIRVAHTLRADAPAIARKALQFATASELPVEATGLVLSLAHELELSELGSAAMRRLLSDPQASEGSIRFGTVDEIIAFMEERSRERRERLEGWRRRRMPFALAVAPEIDTFARMFLASRHHRRDTMGEPFPMVLRAGNATRPPEGLAGGDPLGLDLSALLLAHRLGLLDDMEEAFRLKVPASAPEALIAMEAAFETTPPEAMDAMRDVLEGRSAVRIGAEPPDGILRPDEEQLEVPEGSVFRTLARRAFRAGHLSVERLTELSVPIDEEVDVPTIGRGILCDQTFILGLWRFGVLEPIARTTPIFLADEGGEALRRLLDAASEGNRLHDLVRDLRLRLARRLSIGVWEAMVASPSDADDARTWPPHVCCLFETLRAQQRDQARVWIEDATLSGAGPIGVVSLPDMLAWLRANDRMPDARWTETIGNARTLGYGFIPVEPSEPFAELLRSPRSDDGVIETPGLAAFRRWFAEQTSLLGLIPLPDHVDGDQRIEGEARHTLGCLGLANETLALVWTHPDLPLKRRLQFTEWIWTNLRIDRLPGLPADVDPGSRIQVRALQLAGALDLPLVKLLNGVEIEDGTWTAYARWVTENCVDFPLEMDPVVRDEALGIVASQLAKILQVPVDLPTAHIPRVRRHFEALVRRYLNLLPESLSEILAERCGFDIRKGMRTTTTLAFDAKDGSKPFQIALPQLVSACDRAFELRRDRHVERISGTDGREASIAFGSLKAGRTPTVEIEFGNRRFPLDALLIGLLPSAVERRVIPDVDRVRLENLRGGIRAQDLDTVLNLAEAGERFELLDELVQGDLHHRLERLSRRVRDEGSLSVDDLALPSPEIVASWLRVRTDRELDAQFAEAARCLCAELGPEETFDRLAAVPIGMSEEVLSLFLRDAGGDGIEAGRVGSALLAVAELRRLVRRCPEDRISAEIADVLVSAMADTMPLIVALVRYFAAAACTSDEWTSLSPKTRIVLLWAYSDLVVRAIGAPGAGAEEAATWLADHTAFPMTERLDFGRSGDWYRAATIELEPQRALANCFALLSAKGLGDRLPDESWQRSRDLVGRTVNGVWMPAFPLARTTTGGPQDIWLMRDPLAVDALGHFLAAGDPLVNRNDDDLAGALMDGYEQVGGGDLIAAVLFDVDLDRVSTATRDRMLGLVDSIDMGRALDPLSGGLQRSLLFEASLRAMVDDVPGVTKLVVRWAGRFAEGWPMAALEPSERRERKAASAMLADVVLRFAFGTTRPAAERFAIFGTVMGKVVDAWPDARSDVLRHVDVVIRAFGSDAADALWSVVSELRMRS